MSLLEDPNLEGENAETPSTTPVETITPDKEITVNPEGAGSPSAEEVVWNSLSGSTQERIKELVHRAKTAEEKESVARDAQFRYSATPAAPSLNPDLDNPEIQAGVKRLSDIGLATKTEVDQTVNDKIGNIVYHFELEKLSDKYDGTDGRPSFDRVEYEDYVNSHPQYRSYTPEDVYQKMYAEELFDWKVKQSGATPNRGTMTTLRPGKTQVKDEPLTPELIEQRLQEPDGRAWYEKNQDKINAVLARR